MGSVNFWTPMHAGDIDPFHALGPPYCSKQSPNSVYYCTRPLGHIGLHVATGIGVCCDSWQTIPREMQLPEGF